MQQISLDISQFRTPQTIHAKQGDVGRKFIATITDADAPYQIPAGASLSVWYSGTSGMGNYTNIADRSAFVVNGNAVTVELIAQMVLNKGGGRLCLILTGSDGTQLGLWDIPYAVEAVPGMNSSVAQQHFTALSAAVRQAETSAVRAETAAATFETDTTLSKKGKAADAYFVGTVINSMNSNVSGVLMSHSKSIDTLTREAKSRSLLYADPVDAINDINAGTTSLAQQDPAGATVRVSVGDNGTVTLKLLEDVEVSEILTVQRDIVLALNGHRLGFTAADAHLKFEAWTSCVIDGTVSGSAIYKSTADSGTINLIRADNKKLIILGGVYTLLGPAETAVAFRIHTEEFEMQDAHITCEAAAGGDHSRALQLNTNATLKNCTVMASGSKEPEAVYIGSMKTTVQDCTLSVNSAGNAEATAYGIRVHSNAEAATISGTKVTVNAENEARGIYNNSAGGILVSGCNVSVTTYAADGDAAAYSVYNDGEAVAHIENSTIFTDAPGDDGGSEPCSIGIMNTGVLFCKDTNVTGTLCGCQNNDGAQLYVSGGIFKGFSHGGFYLAHGANGIAYIRDAKLCCGNYDGQFTDYFASANVAILAALYMGGGTAASNSNVTAYLDGCSFDSDGTFYTICMRGSLGETGHILNISNSEVDSYIRMDNDTMTLNVGVGTNITNDTVYASAVQEGFRGVPNFTNKLYRRHHAREQLTGKDFETLAKYYGSMT